MTFMDFLEYCGATMTKVRDAISDDNEKNGMPAEISAKVKECGLFDLSSSHIFYLGDDAEIEESIEPIVSDLMEESSHELPLPYQDTSCVSQIDDRDPRTGKAFKAWLLDRIIAAGPEVQKFSIGIIPPSTRQEIAKKGWTVNQFLILLRIVERRPDNVMPEASMVHVWYCGSEDGKYLIVHSPMKNILHRGRPWTRELLKEYASAAIPPILKQAAAISHPMNYIVKSSPALTPREKRRKERGIEPSIRKKPHFIVVDHDALISMRPKGNGTHASPIPHHRRGHWMKLADRCRHAKLLGKKKTWVRPAFIGDRKFSDAKNLYEVLLDFKPVTQNGQSEDCR